jgi:23S rRNA pseudouridine1911/1915/1917 synthase
VPDALDGERVDRALALLTGWSRGEVQELVRRGDVRVEGRIVAKSHRVAAGDALEVRAAPAPDVPPGPEDVPVAVRYEDDDVVVVAKPAGLVVHPGAGHAGGTLVNGLLARYPEMAAVGDPHRPGLVHRLDRDTSGLLVVARSARAHEALVAALGSRLVARGYRALVWGVPEAPRGVIDAPIGRSEARRTRMAVREAGRPARTRYEVVDARRDPTVAVLRCELETGRTHQVRVHLAAVGHPVVGDATYGGRRPGVALDRPFLHAAELAFDHPVTGARVELIEPLPAELRRVLDELGLDDALPGAPAPPAP